MIQIDYRAQASEQFKLVETNTVGAYNIVNKNSGQCLDVESASTLHGARVQQYTCGDCWDQKFTLSPAASGCFSLIAVHSGKCLDVTAGSTLSGALIQQWTCGGGSNQLLKVDTTLMSTAAATRTPLPTPIFKFLRAVSLSGPAFSMENHAWESGIRAVNLAISGGSRFSN